MGGMSSFEFWGRGGGNVEVLQSSFRHVTFSVPVNIDNWIYEKRYIFGGGI